MTLGTFCIHHNALRKHEFGTILIWTKYNITKINFQ